MTVWFDVEDLVHYFRVGNKRISGIQRLSFEIFRGAIALGEAEIRFVRHGTRPNLLVPVAWADLLADFGGDESRPAAVPAERAVGNTVVVTKADATPRSGLRLAAKRIADRLPPEIRRPLVLAAVMQVQVLGALAAFAVQLAALPMRRGIASARGLLGGLRWRGRLGSRSAPETFDALARPGDSLVVLGAPWNRERYSDIARWVRDEKRMRFGVLVHDLVPIRHPEWCHRGTPKAFREWYSDVLPFCDAVLANSRHTAQDVEAYARESRIVLNGRVTPLPVGTGFGPAGEAGEAATGASARLPKPGGYVLFVSTLEARKNHALAVRVWSLLLDEVAAGRREPRSVPDLVFAGRIGWLVSDLVGQLESTGWLGGRVRFIADPSDAELRALYAGCMFTFFPSLHEGWGLPVTESLAFGKPCLSSNAASLPEAGGALCRYFDPESLGSAHAAIAAVLDDPALLHRWQTAVREGFRPAPWTETARALLDVLDRLGARAVSP